MFQLFFQENRLLAVPILHQSTHIAELLPQESPLAFLFDVIHPLSYLATQPNLLDMEASLDKTKHVLEKWTDEKQDVLAEVRKFGTVDELLPPPGRLMTANNYREKVAIPRVKALFAWCKQLVAKLRKAQEENRTLRQQLDKGETASQRLYDKAGKFDKLVEILGLDRVEKYLEEHALGQRHRDRQNEKRNWIDR